MASKHDEGLSLEHASPATKLLEKRRQMFEVQQKLDRQQEEFARREEAFRLREEALRKKDLELQESLIKFNKFLQENEAKRNRADKRYEEEKKHRMQKEEEIDKLKEELERDELEKQALQVTLKRSLRFQGCLENAVEASEEFSEVSEILNRYRTLQNAHNDLKQKAKATEVLNEEKRAEFSQYRKDRSTDILNFNNDIAKLQKKLEQFEANRIRVQSEVDTSISATSDKKLVLGQIFMATKNLVQRCTSKGHGQKLKHLEQEEGDRQKLEEEKEKEKAKAAVHDPNVEEKTKEQLDAEELLRKGEQTASDLDVIRRYLIDFSEIVKNCPKEKRNFRSKSKEA
eukprot:g3071.t1